MGQIYYKSKGKRQNTIPSQNFDFL